MPPHRAGIWQQSDLDGRRLRRKSGPLPANECIRRLQMRVYVAYLGQTFEYLHDRRLTDVPADGEWFIAVCKNRCWLREQNKQCDACAWFGHCGGCRALGIPDAGEKTDKFDYSASAPPELPVFQGQLL